MGGGVERVRKKGWKDICYGKKEWWGIGKETGWLKRKQQTGRLKERRVAWRVQGHVSRCIDNSWGKSADWLDLVRAEECRTFLLRTKGIALQHWCGRQASQMALEVVLRSSDLQWALVATTFPFHNVTRYTQCQDVYMVGIVLHTRALHGLKL